MDDSLGSIKVSAIKRAIENMNDDVDLSFEFIVASFFPDAYKNMQSLLKDAYTQGYIQASEGTKYEDKILS